jgi:hypothetical protein
MAVQKDGRILVGASNQNENGRPIVVVRLTSSGAVDHRFGTTARRASACRPDHDGTRRRVGDSRIATRTQQRSHRAQASALNASVNATITSDT